MLKSPAHVNGMQALANVYPDACIIQTHRDPAKVLASTCSLVGLMRKIFSDELDPRATGTELLKTFSRDIERMLRVRDVLPAERVRDVRYADLLRDPCGMVRRIYEHFGLSVSAQMEAGMRRWLEAHRQHQHGVHRYSLEQFGIQREELDRTSAAYRAHFDIAREA